MDFDFEGMSEDLQKLISLDEVYQTEEVITKMHESELETLPLVDHFNHLEIIRASATSNLEVQVNNVLIQ
ncbi:unnamed protein product [Acanthoscelides obtectus]|uniref:Uncharacterized protein n=1 Tax=Acanthoscelides obtectus TaxID=200917 RepID=A0A9P0PZ12_ACAOB|nr:unnamed protein product [Acanthoscelides obtectus]CAK1678101.1 hypothetical protein AOBTE_LOCUS31754 [Acanthoscelides obtectus]